MDALTPDADPSRALAGLLRSRRDQYARLHEFNLLPSRHLHASWHDTLFPAAMRPLLERAGMLDARTHRWLSAYLIDQPRFGRRDHWTPTPSVVLALLSPTEVLDLARRIGAAIAGVTLRPTLVAADAGAARRALGDGLHDFALARAPLLVTPLEQEALASRCAAVRPEALADDVEALGVDVLRTAWEDEDLWPRASLRLPRIHAERPSGAVALPPSGAARLALRIAREGDPRWPTSFAPAAA